MAVIYDESLDGNLDIEEPKICVMKRRANERVLIA